MTDTNTVVEVEPTNDICNADDEGSGLETFTIVDESDEYEESYLDNLTINSNLQVVDSVTGEKIDSKVGVKERLTNKQVVEGPTQCSNEETGTKEEKYHVNEAPEPSDVTQSALSEENHNSEVPVKEEKEDEVETIDDDEVEPIEEEKESEPQTHPYLCLIENFEIPKDLLKLTTVGNIRRLEKTPHVVVNDRDAFQNMLHTLRNVKEFALELHFNAANFNTELCLIAISIKDKNFLVDGFKLRDQLLLLTEIFLNPKIVKIIYGAKVVLKHLQTRLHLYMVNIFDVEKAKNIVYKSGEKQLGLSSLIKKEFFFERDKIIKPDFKARPLTLPYIRFCTANAHYLVYLYHNLKNKLLIEDPDVYKNFLDQCRNSCKTLYNVSETDQLHELESELKKQQACQMDVLKKLFVWRKEFSKKNNLPIDLILPRGRLLNLARSLTTCVNEIMDLCPPVLSNYKDSGEELRKIIVDSKLEHKVALTGRQRRQKKDKQNYKLRSQVNQAAKRKMVEPHPPTLKQKRMMVEFRNAAKVNQPQQNLKKKQNVPNVANKYSVNDVWQNPFSNESLKNIGNNKFSPKSTVSNPFSLPNLNPTAVVPSLSFQNSSSSSGYNPFDDTNDEDDYQHQNFSGNTINHSLTSVFTQRRQHEDIGRPSRDFGDNRYKNLNVIDQRIHSLDRQYTGGGRNDYKRNNSQPYRRRF